MFLYVTLHIAVSKSTKEEYALRRHRRHTPQWETCMNVRFSLVWLLTVLLVLLSPLSHAETTSRDRSFNLTFNYTGSNHVRISFFSHSRHKGGNPYSRFNEHQPGFMGEWAPSRESPIRTFLGAVSNSRDCSALFYGVAPIPQSSHVFRLLRDSTLRSSITATTTCPGTSGSTRDFLKSCREKLPLDYSKLNRATT